MTYDRGQSIWPRSWCGLPSSDAAGQTTIDWQSYACDVLRVIGGQEQRGFCDVPGRSHAPHRAGGIPRFHHLLRVGILAGDLLEDQGVFIKPGITAFTRMPSLAYCRAKPIVKLFTAAFAA